MRSRQNALVGLLIVSALVVLVGSAAAAPLVVDANILSGKDVTVSSTYGDSSPDHFGCPANLVNNHGGGGSGDFIFQPGDSQQRAVITGFNSEIKVIRIWSGNDLFPGQVTIKSSLAPDLGLGDTYETALGGWTYSDSISTWVNSGTYDLDDMALYYRDVAVNAPAGTQTLYLDFGASRTSGPNPAWGASRISEVQAFAVPEPGTLVALAGAGVALMAYAWRKRRS